MKIEYDNEIDAMCIKLAQGPSAESDEVYEGVIFDYDKKGKIIGIEILDVSKRLTPKTKLSFIPTKSRVNSLISSK